MRLKPPKPPYSPDVAKNIARWKGQTDIETPEIFEAFHIHPDLATRAGILGAGLLGHGLLPLRDREIVVHRVTGMLGAEHEWGLHATVFAEAAGLTQDQVDATIMQGCIREAWSESDAQLIDMIDELSKSAQLSDDSWAQLKARYSDEQLVEFIILVGWYRTVASMCNVLQVDPHPQCRRFPGTNQAP